MEAIGAPVAYSTAKTVLIAFAKNLARKVAPEVRVNVIAPGNVIFQEVVGKIKSGLIQKKRTNATNYSSNETLWNSGRNCGYVGFSLLSEGFIHDWFCYVG